MTWYDYHLVVCVGKVVCFSLELGGVTKFDGRRVVVPKDVREALGFRAGERLAVYFDVANKAVVIMRGGA